MAPPPVEELFPRLRAGDPRAFDAVYALYAPRLLRFLRRLCQNREAAEDALQEAWVKLAAHAHELPADTDLPAWLFTVARNAWIGRARKDGRLVELGAASSERSGEPSPEARAQSSLTVERLERALASLGERDREILLLVGIEELGHAAAAAVLGVDDVVFRQRLHRARKRLLALLSDEPRRASSDWRDE